ncbi:CLUMA_CG013459, isoform A [Clunio marinus]|uniref:CLUMA_CG013459, isoform A n=1 Tax=Clunio marinus TaxID=568069 RepID=A0A1J1INX5_9DIPT|nr:CLUMA_CG013459, isoform A [Clunio marinus]
MELELTAAFEDLVQSMQSLNQSMHSLTSLVTKFNQFMAEAFETLARERNGNLRGNIQEWKSESRFEKKENESSTKIVHPFRKHLMRKRFFQCYLDVYFKAIDYRHHYNQHDSNI